MVRRDDGSVDVGRGTIYGNPVKIGRVCPVCGDTHNSPGSTLDCYKKYLFARICGDPAKAKWGEQIALRGSVRLRPGNFADQLMKLLDEELFCPGCGIGLPTCHARIIERAIDWLKQVQSQP
jgi:hypothetical protein